jgi:DNA-binding NarL/FixJ family response regulator
VIRVLVADDLDAARRSLRNVLGRSPGIEVVGEATSGPEAVERARELHPDVVLMDVRMPGGDGISATRQLTAAAGLPAIPVVVMTFLGEDHYLFEAIEAGASGFLPKDSRPEEFVAALRLAASGKAMLPPAVTARVLTEFARRGAAQAVAESPLDTQTRAALLGITARELDVLAALAHGFSDAEIAAELHLETSTVKSHLHRLRSKLHLRNRSALLLWAIDKHLVAESRS